MLLDVALSLSSVILYIISTYVPNHVRGSEKEGRGVQQHDRDQIVPRRHSPTAAASYLSKGEIFSSSGQERGRSHVCQLSAGPYVIILAGQRYCCTHRLTLPEQVLGYVQFCLACVFSLNWLFWLWVAPNRVHYVLGSSTAIDAVTILPEFVLFGLATSSAVPATVETLPQLNFLRMLR